MHYTTLIILASAAFAGAMKHPYSNTTITSPPTTTASTTYTVSTGTVACKAQLDACVAIPFANEAVCYTNYVKCLGHTPSTTTIPPPIQTAVAGCKAKLDDCVSKPDANEAVCHTYYDICITGTSVCQAELDACVAVPYANEAVCHTYYALCLDNPPYIYTTEVVTQYTTYCPTPTTFTYGTITYTATASQTVTITNCPCTVTKPAGPIPTATCKSQLDDCVSKPDANEAVCHTYYDICIGYNPFTSTVTLAPPTVAPPGPIPTATCKSQLDDCVSKPDANEAVCHTYYDICIGYNPFTSTVAPAPPVTISLGTPIVLPVPTTAPEVVTVTPVPGPPATVVLTSTAEPVMSSIIPPESPSAAPPPVETTPVVVPPPVETTPMAPPPVETTPVVVPPVETTPPVTPISPTTTAPAQFTNAASSNKAAGALIAVGVAVALL